MLPMKSLLMLVLLVAFEGFLLSKLFGEGLLIRGSFLSRAVVVVLVSVTSFICLYSFYRPKIRSSKKKAVLVTGCDTGIGHLLAKHLEFQGFTVFACCFNATSEDSEKLKSDSGLMHVLQMDVTRDEEVEDCVAKVLEILRREEKYLWAVVNNAGIGHIGFIEMLSIKNYEDILRVNTLGVIRVTKAFVPLLRGHGRVINVTSLASRLSYPYFSAYSMSKYATLAFSDCLRREMIAFKVKVITIEPSRYRTSIMDSTSNTDFFLKTWDRTPDYITSQYGREYFEESARRMKTHLEDARNNIKEVIDVIEEAIWAVNPDNHYIPFAKTAMLFQALSMLPESVLDSMAVKCLLPKELKPAHPYRSTQTEQT